MKVSIVIPNWNGAELLLKNLPKVIAAKSQKVNQIAEIIVVDDKSTDNSLKVLKENFASEVKLIKHTQNRGFPAAVNTGVRTSKSPLVCLLNSDVIPSKLFLKSVIDLFKNKKLFAVSLSEVSFGGPTAGKFEKGYVVFEERKRAINPTQTFWVSGGSGVFRRDIWIKLKGFDEELMTPFYWEDTDLGYRALKRGYELLWDPGSKVIHKHESTINQKNFDKKYVSHIRERNQLLFNWKNLTSKAMLRRHIRGVIQRTFRHPGYLRVVLMALSKLKQVRKKRGVEKKESVVSDEAVFAKFST